jgi:hypothetical protein
MKESRGKGELRKEWFVFLLALSSTCAASHQNSVLKADMQGSAIASSRAKSELAGPFGSAWDR